MFCVIVENGNEIFFSGRLVENIIHIILFLTFVPLGGKPLHAPI